LYDQSCHKPKAMYSLQCEHYKLLQITSIVSKVLHV